MREEEAPAPAAQPREGTRLRDHRLAFPLALAVTALFHVAVIFTFERPSLIFSDEPNAWLDYDTHIEQAYRALEALDGWGKSWSYDPHLLAGNPNGTIFAADNKGWELWTYALWKLGLPKGMAFNLFILLAHLALPWVVLGAARLFGLGRWASLAAAGMGLGLWYLDSFARWTWWCGMVAYGFSGYLFLLPLGLFYRYLEDRRPSRLVWLAITMAAGHLVHPYTFVVLVFPLLCLYGRAFRRLRAGHHLAIIGAAVAVVLANAYWLVPSLRHWHYIVVIDSGVWAQSTLSFALSDFVGLLREPLATGVLDVRTGLRVVLLTAAIIALVRWGRVRDPRMLPFGVGLGAMLAVTYLGGYSSFFTHIQPYRHILPAMYFAVIPAAALLEETLVSGALARLPRLAWAVGGLGLVMITGNLARDAAYFLPGLLPDPGLTREDEVALRTTNPGIPGIKGRQMEFRHQPTFADFDAIAEWVSANDDGGGRFLVQYWVLGEHLAWRTDAEILGGFRLRNVHHSQANLFRRFDESAITAEGARKHLEDFAVKWVIVSGAPHPIESFEGLLRPVGRIPPFHRVYATNVRVSYVAEGPGEVEASLNRIEVTGTDPGNDVVIRYHFHESLVCREGCQIVQEPLDYDPVGLIRVPAPHPADFVIENGY
jgi:hypothetical protein